MRSQVKNTTQNDLRGEDKSVHRWYRFVLSFPPHLVREYLAGFKVNGDQMILDPFCGMGTTIVECKKLGIASQGVEANPMAHFASSVKINWSPDPIGLRTQAAEIADRVHAELARIGLDDNTLAESHTDLALRKLRPELEKLLLTDSISPLPLHKTLVLLDCLNQYTKTIYSDHLRLALARSTVQSMSNLHFGPEVGVRSPKVDVPVIQPWLAAVEEMAADLLTLSERVSVATSIHLADARRLGSVLAAQSVDVVITSPPYPNEKDYSRATRLEAVLLGFLHSQADLRAFKRTLLRSNTRTVYKGDSDDLWIAQYRDIQALAEHIEARRIELGKTSGFERLYAKVTKLYFGGMARHLAELRPLLKPGAMLAYVVGDQASYFQVMIRTGQLLIQIAEGLGYECVRVDLFRTRLATATGEQLREEVIILRWPGTS